ncbi:Hypothetical_protein [Hexamita inflata]|uniref:Hypothetical_protein n=1 Tax=Hexamita inflata TaxID=28002 RepID=A0AA86R222_9EUKA|nr:Hypothetical protein HINF_LOCUS51879 [Hexamita inflata]
MSLVLASYLAEVVLQSMGQALSSYSRTELPRAAARQEPVLGCVYSHYCTFRLVCIQCWIDFRVNGINSTIIHLFLRSRQLIAHYCCIKNWLELQHNTLWNEFD